VGVTGITCFASARIAAPGPLHKEITVTTTPPRPRTIIQSPLGEIRLNIEQWKNPRTFTGLSTTDDAEMAASLKQLGMLEKPKAVQVKDASGVFVLAIDGQRRIRGGIEAWGKKHVIELELLREEVITDFTPELGAQLLLEALTIATQRKGLSGYEISENAQRLRDVVDSAGKPIHKLKDIGIAINRDESWVSKMLKARSHATPELMTRWRKGEITDEQFRDLAEAKPEKQAEAAEATAKAQKSGDKAGARATAKETATIAKREKTAEKPKRPEKPAKAKGGKAKDSKQRDMFAEPPKAEPEKRKPTPPSKAMLEETSILPEKRPPTHDLVKGIFLGVDLALGKIAFEDLPKPWHQYIARVGGTGASATATKGGKGKKISGKKASKAKGKKK
jgi:hypothetical protein